ncbi:hypothetical protein V2I01_10775 [Micromonospora sp. BRA006-A]|nr:hypothetical protein [Micromonospora sp. BRA006-A]
MQLMLAWAATGALPQSRHDAAVDRFDRAAAELVPESWHRRHLGGTDWGVLVLHPADPGGYRWPPVAGDDDVTAVSVGIPVGVDGDDPVTLARHLLTGADVHRDVVPPFALLAFDHDRLALQQDWLGMARVFTGTAGGVTAWCTRPGLLAAFLHGEARPDPAGWASYLITGHFGGDLSPLADIRLLRPGERITGRRRAGGGWQLTSEIRYATDDVVRSGLADRDRPLGERLDRAADAWPGPSPVCTGCTTVRSRSASPVGRTPGSSPRRSSPPAVRRTWPLTTTPPPRATWPASWSGSCGTGAGWSCRTAWCRPLPGHRPRRRPPGPGATARRAARPPVPLELPDPAGRAHPAARGGTRAEPHRRGRRTGGRLLVSPGRRRRGTHARAGGPDQAAGRRTERRGGTGGARRRTGPRHRPADPRPGHRPARRAPDRLPLPGRADAPVVHLRVHHRDGHPVPGAGLRRGQLRVHRGGEAGAPAAHRADRPARTGMGGRAVRQRRHRAVPGHPDLGGRWCRRRLRPAGHRPRSAHRADPTCGRGAGSAYRRPGRPARSPGARPVHRAGGRLRTAGTRLHQAADRRHLREGHRTAAAAYAGQGPTGRLALGTAQPARRPALGHRAAAGAGR